LAKGRRFKSQIQKGAGVREVPAIPHQGKENYWLKIIRNPGGARVKVPSVA